MNKPFILNLLLIILLTACMQQSSEDQEAKLSIPSLSVRESSMQFESRRQALLQGLVGEKTSPAMVSDTLKDIYSSRAIACLYTGKMEEAANQRIRRTAEWFDHPHPGGRDHQGEVDFAAIKLCRAYHLFKDSGKLEAETVSRIRRFFFSTDFESVHPSENHALLFRTARYLVAGAFPDSVFLAYRDKGSSLAKQDHEWLINFIQYRARRGWGEFDSPCYFKPEWECMITLFDHSPDPDIKKLSGMMLNLLLADMAVDSRNGMYCGAHGRIYAGLALSHSRENSYPLQYLYFGNVDPATIEPGHVLVDALVSSFRPADIILDIALNRNEEYINKERKQLHNASDIMPETPLTGSIRKYTYYTPDFIMGTVQKQDDYPESCDCGWYAHHEQHEWDLSFPTRTTSKIFTQHPGVEGNEHGYWTGDLRCGCGHFFQHEGAVLALYDIPEDQPYQFIHAYVPKQSFDKVVEKDGYVFIQEGAAVAALYMLNGYEWNVMTRQMEFSSGMKGTSGWTFEGVWKDKEIISQGDRNGAVCEAGLLSDYGSFNRFMKEIMSNEIVFDTLNMSLRYHSGRYGDLSMNTDGSRRINGQEADLDYQTYDCPYMQSEWDSGVIHLQKDEKTLTLDFMNRD